MPLISQKHPLWKTMDNDTTNYLHWRCDGNIYWTCDAESTRLIICSQRMICHFSSQGVALPARDSARRTFKRFIAMVLEAKQQGAPCRSISFSFSPVWLTREPLSRQRAALESVSQDSTSSWRNFFNRRQGTFTVKD